MNLLGFSDIFVAQEIDGFSQMSPLVSRVSSCFVSFCDLSVVFHFTIEPREKSLLISYKFGSFQI